MLLTSFGLRTYNFRLALRISLFFSKSAFRSSTDSFKTLTNSSFCSGMRQVLKKSMILLTALFSGTTCSLVSFPFVLFTERCRYTNFSYNSPVLLFALYNRSYTRQLNHFTYILINCIYKTNYHLRFH